MKLPKIFLFKIISTFVIILGSIALVLLYPKIKPIKISDPAELPQQNNRHASSTQDANLQSAKKEQPPTNTPQFATLTGLYVCLPLRDSADPHTDECALGLMDDNGQYFALDTTGLSDDNNFFPTGTRLEVRGSVVPIEEISAVQWQKYDIRGIMKVLAAKEVE